MDANIAITQFTASATFVWAMQQLKNASWFPLLQKEGQIIFKRAASILAAIFIHTGISHVWNPGTVPGSHVLILTIPPLSVMAVEVWHWLGQYVMQEGWYQLLYNKLSVPGAQNPLPAPPAHQP
jgi:hypothetical protein